MKTQLIVDAACDLPRKFIDDRGIFVLPINIEIDGETIEDKRENNILADVYNSGRISIDHNVNSKPLDPDDVETIFIDEFVESTRYAIVQTASNKRSTVYENCEKAQLKILAHVRSMRTSGEIDTPFGMRIMNAATMFSGQGVLAAFTSDLIAGDKATKDVLRMAEAFKSKLYAFAIPSDVSYVRERARKRGEDSIGAFGALIAKSLDIKPIIQFHADETESIAKERGFEKAANSLFDYAIRRIETGLLSPYIVVSIAGNPDDFSKYESYKNLQVAAKKAKVELLPCIMGLAGGLNLGQGSISLALACETHDFAD